MGTTHPAVQWVILAFPQVCNRWGMKLIIHLHIAPEDIRSAGIALLVLSLSTRCGRGGEWSASHPNSFTSGNIPACTHSTEGWYADGINFFPVRNQTTVPWSSSLEPGP